jgi:hypothetical protein
MLNELLALEHGMRAYGFASVPRHPDISRLLKGDVVRVRLGGCGGIAEVELLAGETRPEIWTLRDGNHNGFPGLKTAIGLAAYNTATRAAQDERWKTAKTAAAKRSEIERMAAEAVLDYKLDDWPKPGHRARIAERLNDLLTLADSAETHSVPAAFERFLAALTLQPPFLHALHGALMDRARNGEDSWLDFVRAALVGPIPLAIDVTRDFRRDAGDERQIEAVSRALLDVGANSGPMSSNRDVCALTGAATRLLVGSFPQPTLPSLGQTYLFSRNTDIRAFARYNRNGPSSMPVDADLVGRFSGALATLTHESRRGKIWRLLPAEAGDKQDLFIAFVASAAASSLCDAADDEDDDAETRVGPTQIERAMSRLVEFWQGVADKAKPGEQARIMILRTIDPGNRKAVYERSVPVDGLHRCARDWATAMGNAPSWISFPLFKAKRLVRSRPRHQSPLSLIALSRKVYVRGGRDAVDAPGVSGAEAMALFLEEGDRPRRALQILRLLLARQTGLLVGVAQADRRGQLKDFDPKATSRADALRSASWMGALLSFLNRTQELYMADAGFKLGQLLSAIDAIHMGYCAEVRGNDVPPTLVGNSVFALAGRNPDRALDVLQTRWKPYHAWANRAGAKNTGEPKDAKSWAVVRAIAQARHAKQLCAELHPILTCMRHAGLAPDEAFRAELLLGYVAGVKSEKTTTKVDSDGKESAE